MAKRTQKSSIYNKLGTSIKRAFNENKSNEIVEDFGGDLPPDLVGIAKLISCEIAGVKAEGPNKGKPLFQAVGIVVQPKIFEGLPVEGLRTNINRKLFTTEYKTDGESVSLMLNDLKKLGVDTDEMELSDLEETLKTLAEEEIYFAFRTWKGSASDDFPNPRVQHTWKGVCEFEEDTTEGEDEPEEDEPEEDEEDKPKKRRTKKKPAEVEPEPEETDWKELGKLADDEDDDALTALIEAADAQGIAHGEYETWSEVAALIADSDDNDEDEEDEKAESNEEEFDPPDKGDFFQFKAPRAKTSAQVQVTRVLLSTKTCNLKNMENGKPYKNIPWNKLIEDE